MKLKLRKILIVFVLGVMAGIFISSFSSSNYSNNELIKLYYESEASTLVSPHHLRKEMDQGHENFILVDLRTKKEYEEEHIIGAINIPANLNNQEFIDIFSKLDKDNPEKYIIIYCYSSACMTGRKAGMLLAQNDIFVKEMSIGWNEWRYEFESWNYPNEWAELDTMEYIHSGPDPGKLESERNVYCKIEGSLTC